MSPEALCNQPSDPDFSAFLIRNDVLKQSKGTT